MLLCVLYYDDPLPKLSCREATQSCNKNVTWKGQYDLCNLDNVSKYPPLSTSPDHELYFIHMNIVLHVLTYYSYPHCTL